MVSGLFSFVLTVVGNQQTNHEVVEAEIAEFLDKYPDVISCHAVPYLKMFAYKLSTTLN